MNKQRKVVITTTYNEMGIIIDTKAEEVAQPNLQPTCNQLAKDICVPCKDTISRQEAIEALDAIESEVADGEGFRYAKWREFFCDLPSAQPEPMSDVYAKAVWTWLLDYQIKAAELKGRYTPYEVLSWVANDWRKEHERSD